MNDNYIELSTTILKSCNMIETTRQSFLKRGEGHTIGNVGGDAYASFNNLKNKDTNDSFSMILGASTSRF